MNKASRLASFVSIILLVLLVTTNILHASSQTFKESGNPAFVPDVVLIQVGENTTLTPNPGGKPGQHFKTNAPGLEAVLSELGVQGVISIFPPGQAHKADIESGGVISLSGAYHLQLDPGTNVEAAVTTLSALPEVVFAEPDYIASLARINPLTIDDPLYAQQWGLAKINVEGAWADTFGSPTVTIAIVDSGIDLTHPDLSPNVWVNPGEIAGNGLDDDSNGYIDDVKGWNFVSSNNDVADENGHGTLVAGIAMAAQNGVGIVGVCPQCRVMPVRVMQNSGAANYSDIAAGILYAAQKGAKVINLSLGGYADSNILRNAITTAANTYGTVIVAGAGNDNLTTPFYPAAYSNVLAVAGSQNDDTKTAFSNYGSWVDVSAPGITIKSTALGGGWADNDGTSFASPFAAGLAGLLRTLHPEWDQATIRSQIIHTVDEIDSLNPANAGLLGSGRINADSAMQTPHPILTESGYTVNGQADGRPVLGATAQMNITLSNDWWDALGVTGVISENDPYVTIVNGNVSFGDITAATSKTNTTPLTFTVASGAGYNHPIDFTLDVSDTSGYSNSLHLTVTTESGNTIVSGTIGADTTWTNDKTYIITGNVGVAPGVTLTIQSGTTVKFNGNFMLNVGGTLIADGTSSQPIQFKSNTTGTWDKILFSDTSVDAIADENGQYISGSILRYVNIEGTTAGIACTTSTPYLSNVSTNSGGINCSLGGTDLWLLDNAITGNVTITGSATAYRNSVTGNLGISAAGVTEDNYVNGTLSLGSGSAKRNTVGGLSIGGTGGTLENNTVSSGNVSLGAFFNVVGNSISGSLTTGNVAIVDHNNVANGITVGGSSTVTWNNVENASGTGLVAGSNITAQYNRLIGNTAGMTASTGLVEHNLIANNTGVGLTISGDAIVTNNTFIGNLGNTIVISSGVPMIQGNNLELNTGTFDIQNNSASPIDASGNWWGTTNSATIDTRIFDYYDDFVKGIVTYQSVLTEPDQAAPGYVRNVTVLPDTTLGIQTGFFEFEFSKPMNTNHFPTAVFHKIGFGTWTIYNSSNSKLNNEPVSGMAVDPDGSVWFATDGNGILKFDGVSWTRFVPSAYGGIIYLNDVAVEASGTVWVTSSGSGVSFYNGTKWTSIEYTLAGAHVNAVAIDIDGTKWFGGDGSSDSQPYSAASYDGTRWQYLEPANSGLPHTYVSDIAIDLHGVKWFATAGGIASFDGTKWETYTPANSELPVTSVEIIAIEPNGMKWFGTSQGIVSFDGASWKIYNTSNSPLPNNSIQALAANSNGVWFCTWGGGCGSFDGTNWNIYDTTNSELPWNAATSILIKSDGSKWFGYKGVAVLNDFPQYALSDGAIWLDDYHYQTYREINSNIPKDSYSITIVNALGFDDIVLAPRTTFGFIVDFAGSITDKTPPTKPIITATGSGNLTTLSANWYSIDPESTITKYRYAIGTTPGGRDVVDWTYVNTPSMKHTELKLTSGVTYYVSAGARNEGGLWSTSGISNGVTAGVAPPAAFQKSSPANKATNVAINPTLKWATSVNAVSYQYCLDAETTNDSTCDSSWKTVTTLSKTLSGLKAKKKYYWQVRAVDPGGIVYANNGTWWSFTTKPLVKTLTSSATQDGWILESGENTNKGGSLQDGTATLLLGDDKDKKQYRGILSFNASSLPDNAIITTITLKVKKQGILGGGNPVTLFQGFMVDVKKGIFGTAALQPTDFQVLANKSYGPFKPTVVNGWYSINLTSAKAQINKLAANGGLTQIRLRFKLDDNNNAIANVLSLFSGNASLASRPKLIIEYYIP